MAKDNQARRFRMRAEHIAMWQRTAQIVLTLAVLVQNKLVAPMEFHFICPP